MPWTEITRREYERQGRRYASDLTDNGWRLIEPLLAPKRRIGRPRLADLRDVLDAVNGHRILPRSGRLNFLGWRRGNLSGDQPV